MFAFAYSQAAAGVRVDNGTGFSPKRGTNRGQYCGRLTSSGSLTMLAAMRPASLRNRAFCLSSAQRSTIISGEPCPACHLLGDRTSNVTVTLIEKRQDAGRGIAYCTADPNHLLNVRAVNMSAWLARLDPLGIGIDITPECAVVDRSGAPSERLFAIGPVTRAAFWEIVAVPDIRNQCAALAKRLGRAPVG